jgi:dihydroorotase
MYDLILRGKAFVNNGLIECELGIEGGKITAIKKTLQGPKKMDLGASIILPAGIDPHVHFRSPGATQKGDFQTESIAAACGGITTVLDMPNTKPSTTDKTGMAEKLVEAKASCIDYGLFAGLKKGQTPEDLDIAKQAVGFKLYMASTTGDLLLASDPEIRSALDMVSKWKRPLCVHAEDEFMIQKKRYQEKDITDHHKIRSPQSESTAITRILALNSSGKTHIAHVSSIGGLEALKGTGATCEVAPHHLLLDIGIPSSQFLKVNPPIRTKNDRAALWDGLRSGAITILGSDHAPHTKKEKDVEFDIAPSGVPGVETM